MRSSDLSRDILQIGADIESIARRLDALDDAGRVELACGLSGKAQARLWTLAAGRAVRLEDLVPADRRPLEPVHHHGRNALPAFTRFEKRFCRPSSDRELPCLWGYNEGPLRPLVGPGYFVCRPTPGDLRGETVVDYYQVPPERPPGWPRIQPNEVGLQRLVYASMYDFLRKVSEHVTIGRAWRHRRQTNNYFVLCRER